MHKEFDTGLVWFRRDLRVQDNAALSAAVQRCALVHCVFVFDRSILDGLPTLDRRVEFIRDSLAELDEALREAAGRPRAGLIALHGVPVDCIPQLCTALGIDAVFAAHDYEPQSIARARHRPSRFHCCAQAFLNKLPAT